MKKRLTLLVVLMLYCCAFTFAQTGTVKGVVKDDQGLPLPGVTIRVKGTTNATTTDLNGKYNITVPGTATLVFSFVGFDNAERPVNNFTEINVSLTGSNKQLNEVVVVGYGSQKKKDITSSIATVSTTDVSERPIVNTSEILAGKAAGVQVFNASGAPGGNNLSIRIRGLSSPNGTEPLYVINGVVASNTEGLDPNDVESISVLKDPSAAGIYGSLGATNGVVLITTKKGAKGKSRVDINFYTGDEQIIKKLDMLNTSQFESLLNDEYTNAGQSAPSIPNYFNANNNWQNLVYRNANQNGVNVGFSGGNDDGNYHLSVGHLNQDGIINNTNYERYNINLTLEQKVKSWLSVGTNFGYNREDGRVVNDDASAQHGGVVLGTLYTPPNVPIYSPVNPGYYQTNLDNASNPIGDIYTHQNHYIKNNLLGNLHLDIQLPFDLKYHSQLGVVLDNYNNDIFTPAPTPNSINSANSENYETFRYTLDNTLTYHHLFQQKHDLTAIVGLSALEEKYTDDQLSGSGLPPDITTLNAATSQPAAATYKTDWTDEAYFGRINYAFEDKYLFTGSIRHEGSSRSGINNQWGTFPAISGAWRVSKEDFLAHSDFISDLKIRASWGEVGNLGPNLYPSYSALASTGYLFGGNPQSGYYPTSPGGNPDLKWERTKGYNIGFDLSVFRDRLTLTADIYNKKTDDLIFPQITNTADAGAANTTYVNLPGYVQNKGFEVSLTGKIVATAGFNWSATLNASNNTNVVQGLSAADNGLQEGGVDFGGNGNATYLSTVRNGLPLGAFWGYTFTGVDPATGNALYKATTGGTTSDINSASQSYLGSGIPKWVFGFSNNLNYQNFTLDFLMDAVTGNKIFDATRVETEGMYSDGNGTTAVLSRWEKPGDITDVPKAVYGATIPPSSRFVENGAFLRLKSISLGYNIKSDFFDKHGVKLHIYVNATNLFTITGYKGYYPEVNSFNSGTQGQGSTLMSPSSTALGIDDGIYPATKTYTAGINASF